MNGPRAGAAPPLRDIHESLRPIAVYVGWDAVEALLRLYPGLRVWVPKTWRPGHPLNALGEELAQRLCGALGGEHLTLPKTMLTQEAVHRRVHELHGEGLTRAAIALAVGITERTVYKMLAGAAPKARGRRANDPRQTNLLDQLDEPDAA